MTSSSIYLFMCTQNTYTGNDIDIKEHKGIYSIYVYHVYVFTFELFTLKLPRGVTTCKKTNAKGIINNIVQDFFIHPRVEKAQSISQVLFKLQTSNLSYCKRGEGSVA